jgi:NAD(P)-dependent dehydrogenase (short-subunit alcohol dehydrogenase family)
MVSTEGSVAVVTGGHRGLGKALVQELLQRGATKV